jgi:hypothetical protein
MRIDRTTIEDENLSHDNMYGHALLIITTTTTYHQSLTASEKALGPSNIWF